MHIIPRRPGDFTNNDDIYARLEQFDDDFVSKLSHTSTQAQKWAELAIDLKTQLSEQLILMQEAAKF